MEIKTDGSKINGQTIASILIEKTTYKFCLSNKSSNYAVEIHVLFKSSECVNEEQVRKKFIVYSD